MKSKSVAEVWEVVVVGVECASHHEFCFEYIVQQASDHIYRIWIIAHL